MTHLLPDFTTIDPTSFPERLKTLLNQQQQRFEACLETTTSFTWENLIQVLEDIEDQIEKFFSPLSHLNAVKNSKAMRKAYEACLPLLTQFETRLHQNKVLYKAIQSIPLTSLNSTQQKIIQDRLRDFEHAGVALPDLDKQRFETIETRLSALAAQFENHLIDAELAYKLHITAPDLIKGLPPHTLETAAVRAQNNGWILTLDYPCYHAVMTYAEDRSLRESLYRAYITRASDEGPQRTQFDNGPLISEMLTLRFEHAKLLDFPNYATLSLTTKMAHDPQTVFGFLNGLLNQVHPQAVKELDQLKDFAQTHLGLSTLKPWDIAFASEKRKQDLFTFSEESLRPHFSEDSVWEGMEHLLERLFGIGFKPMNAIKTWDEHVRCYEVVHQQKNVLGYIYVDLFARPHKRAGAWMDSLQTRRRRPDSHLQLPIATLTCNFAPPSSDQKAHFSHDEVLTLFHEMGHCLHHLMTQVEDYSASGLRGVEWDAVELPSQFFENFCWDLEVLQRLSAKNPLPQDKIEALKATQTFQSGLALLRQLEFSLLDIQLHTAEDAINSICQKIREKTRLLPALPEERFLNSFSHCFAGGYAAGYYSYLWAEVLSSDAFSRFEEEGLFNPKTGHDFLTHILAVGSSIPAKQAFEAFRGRAVNPSAFLRHRGLYT